MQERRASLTKRALDAAKPAEEEYQIWDTKIRGFGVRVYPSGAKSFIIQYRNRAGRTRKMVLGRYGPLTVHKAREKAVKQFAAILDGADPSADKAEDRRILTVGQLADLYLREGPSERQTRKHRAGTPIGPTLSGTSGRCWAPVMPEA
jgi:hypothetical protein